MLPYKISPQAEKYIKKIKDKQLKGKFKEAIKEIRANPDVGTQKAGNLKQIFGYDIYHNKTNYEIAYQIVDVNGQLIIFILAGTRENFYDDLKQYVRDCRKYFGI